MIILGDTHKQLIHDSCAGYTESLNQSVLAEISSFISKDSSINIAEEKRGIWKTFHNSMFASGVRLDLKQKEYHGMLQDLSEENKDKAQNIQTQTLKILCDHLNKAVTMDISPFSAIIDETKINEHVSKSILVEINKFSHNALDMNDNICLREILDLSGGPSKITNSDYEYISSYYKEYFLSLLKYQDMKSINLDLTKDRVEELKSNLDVIFTTPPTYTAANQSLPFRKSCRSISL